MTTWPFMHIIIWPLTWLVQLRHIIIWPLTWLVQLWEVPRRTPLLAYINQEFVAIKRNCSDGTPFTSDCLSLAKGLGWRTAGSSLLGTPQLCWGKFHCLSFCRVSPARFFKEINRIDKLTPQWTKRKEKRLKVLKSEMKMGTLTTNSTELKRI